MSFSTMIEFPQTFMAHLFPLQNLFKCYKDQFQDFILLLMKFDKLLCREKVTLSNNLPMILFLVSISPFKRLQKLTFHSHKDFLCIKQKLTNKKFLAYSHFKFYFSKKCFDLMRWV